MMIMMMMEYLQTRKEKLKKHQNTISEFQNLFIFVLFFLYLNAFLTTKFVIYILSLYEKVVK